MATNTVKVTLQIRHDSAEDWSTRNPVLAEGEFGLETKSNDVNHLLIKIGDGVRDWAHLPYLNNFDTSYFKYDTENNEYTFSDDFMNKIHTLEAAAGQAITQLIVTEPPVNDTDVPNKKYVDDAIAAAGHLRREVAITLPNAADADPNTLYMVLAASGDHYEEYMVINGVWDMVGSTGDGGSSGGFALEVATHARLGGVKSAPLDNDGQVMTDKDYIIVDNTGFMTFNQVSTSKLYVPTGDTLVIYGGTA